MLVVLFQLDASLPSTSSSLVLEKRQQQQIGGNGAKIIALAHDTNSGNFAVNMAVGTPSINFNFLLDTSIPDTLLVSSEVNKNVKRYNPATSTTAKEIVGSQFNNVEGSGIYYTDKCSFSDIATATKQMIGVIDIAKGGALGEDLESAGVTDGILGLGIKFDNTTTKPPDSDPLVDTLFQQGAILSNLFSISVSGSKEDAGELVLGGITSNADLNKIVYTESDKNAWIVNITEVQLIKSGGATVSYASSSSGESSSTQSDFKLEDGSQFFVASSESASELPDSAINGLISALQGSSAQIDGSTGYYKIDCNYEKGADSIDVFIASPLNSRTSKPVSYVNVPASKFVESQGVNNDCLFLIKPIKSIWGLTLGSHFLNGFVTVFDGADESKPHVGFAPLIQKAA